MKRSIVWSLLFTVVLLAGCGAEDAQKKAGTPKLSGKLLLAGSSTMAPMMGEIAKRFQSLHPGVQIEVQAGGSGRGVSDARGGKSDIGCAAATAT